ncbi:MAG: hypothetical protein AAF242_00870, partial [Bacteroidota bacterium]
LHPEYRTLPMVWYVPPLSPIQSAVEAGSVPMDGVFPDLKALRIPIEGLTISSDGQVTFPGGWFDMKDKMMFNHHGLKMGISRIGFGFGKGETMGLHWLRCRHTVTWQSSGKSGRKRLSVLLE